MDEIKQIKKEIESLVQWRESLSVSSRIPLEQDRAMRYRMFGSDVVQVIENSTKSSSSENQAVNEGGTGTYNVLKPPASFLRVEVGNIAYYLPSYLI